MFEVGLCRRVGPRLVPHQRCHLSVVATSFRALIDVEVPQIAEAHVKALADLPLFDQARAASWTEVERKRFVGGLYNTQFRDTLLVDVLGRLTGKPHNVDFSCRERGMLALSSAICGTEVRSPHEMHYDHDGYSDYAEDHGCVTAIAVPHFAEEHDRPFAQAYRRQVRRLVTAPPQKAGSTVALQQRWELVAVVTLAARLAVIEHAELLALTTTLGAGEADSQVLALDPALASQLAALLNQEEAVDSPELFAVAQRGFSFVQDRQLSMWQQLGAYVLA